MTPFCQHFPFTQSLHRKERRKIEPPNQRFEYYTHTVQGKKFVLITLSPAYLAAGHLVLRTKHFFRCGGGGEGEQILPTPTWDLIVWDSGQSAESRPAFAQLVVPAGREGLNL